MNAKVELKALAKRLIICALYQKSDFYYGLHPQTSNTKWIRMIAKLTIKSPLVKWGAGY